LWNVASKAKGWLGESSIVARGRSTRYRGQRRLPPEGDPCERATQQLSPTAVTQRSIHAIARVSQPRNPW
jgi:hypothetical protein